ncbi:hypothetical protein [Janthinobacterium sp. RB2R34]|uniref:hypothetical protein n=1 Tax=Janthinobacterium sp. RB2R34 TaxID=3424193 RepID=UPI003F2420E1
MRSNRRYTLWFVNESLLSGQACVYQDHANAPCSLPQVAQLAWRLAPAHPQVQLCFVWEAAYECVWFEQAGSASARQFERADPLAGSSVMLERNLYGCQFRALPEQSARGQVLIHADRSIEAGGSLRLGIGMDGGGSFAVPASPNIVTVFTPVPDAQLVYWISFGAYGLLPDAVLDTAVLNPPARICFPANVDTLTAVLDEQNEWQVHVGSPDSHRSTVGRYRS